MIKYQELIDDIIYEPYVLQEARVEIQQEFEWAKQRCLNPMDDHWCRALLVCMYLLDKIITENDKTKTQHAIIKRDKV